jgi:hypothetical protein
LLSQIPYIPRFVLNNIDATTAAPFLLDTLVPIRHPGQVPRSGMRAGIQMDLVLHDLPRFRISHKIIGLARNDSFVQLQHSLLLIYRQ